MNHRGSDVERNAGLGRLLSQAAPDPAGEAALRRRIVAAASAELAARRLPSMAWWKWNARWAGVTVPVGIAAGLVAAVLVARTPGGSAVAAAPDTASEALATVNGTGALDPLLGTPDRDWLLSAAMQR